LAARQPATETSAHHGAEPRFASKVDTWPSWRSRSRSVGGMVALIVLVGALVALAVALAVLLVWVIVSAAVT
jgi:hypothetical protein